jgi:hypothetical protein
MAVRAVTGYLSVVLSFIVEQIAQPLLLPLVEANLIPDFLVRWGIRALLAGQAASLDKGSPAANVAAKIAYVKDLKTRDIAECTTNANEQHYEASGSVEGGCRFDRPDPWIANTTHTPCGVTLIDDAGARRVLQPVPWPLAQVFLRLLAFR